MNLDDLLIEMEQYAAQNKVPIIDYRARGQLEKIVVEHKPNSILEVGTAIGYSTLLMYRKMPDEGRIVSIEKDAARASMAQSYILAAGLADKIQLIFGDADDVLDKITDSYDMVFIDAAKGQYLNYLRKIIDHLNPGAVVVADNVLFRGMVRDEHPPRRYRTIVKRLQEYLQFVTEDPRFSTKLCDVGDGVAVSYYQGEKKV